jgi:hypothetical protein
VFEGRIRRKRLDGEREEKTKKKKNVNFLKVFEANFHVFKHTIFVLHLVTSRR